MHRADGARCKRYDWSGILSFRQPLRGCHPAPLPLAARASAISSRTCGRRQLAFLAVSATGGARKPNPSEGAEGAAAPCTESAQREPRTALRRLSPRLSLTAHRRLALSLPQSYCLNPERSPTAPSSEGAEGAPAPCTDSAATRGVNAFACH